MRELGRNPVFAIIWELKVSFILLMQLGNASNYNSQKDQVFLLLVWETLSDF